MKWTRFVDRKIIDTQFAAMIHQRKISGVHFASPMSHGETWSLDLKVFYQNS